MRRSSIVIAVGSLLVATGPAGAKVLCGGKGGSVHVRETCKRKETRIDPAVLGLVVTGAQGPQGSQGLVGERGQRGPRGAGLVIRDGSNQNRLVGTVVQSLADDTFQGTIAQVIREVGTGGGDEVVALWLSGTTGFVEANDATGLSLHGPLALSFESGDCSGPALLPQAGPAGAAPLVRPAKVHGGVAYYPTGVTASRTVHSEKTFVAAEQCGGTVVPPDACCVAVAPPDGTSRTTATAATLDLGSFDFVLPFRAELTGPQ